MRRKEPLYRKVNTKARGVHHGFGGKASRDRNTKTGPRSGMAQGVQRGLDYTPLFRYLLSRVGQDWDAVHSEAVARLDREDPIWWLVAPDAEAGRDVVRVGEASYYSGLYIDVDNILRVTDPSITVERLTPQCACCTHSFNGKRFIRPWPGPDGAPLVAPAT